MALFQTAYNKYVKPHEGGYANVKNDKGKETYAGISRRFFPNEEIWTYIDFKKRTEYKDREIPNNTMFPDAQYMVDDFYNRLWHKHRLSEINDQNIANLLFDYIVNSGTRAIKGIQAIVGVSQDGAIGPVTINAINSGNPSTIYNKLYNDRKQLYATIIKNDPSQKVFEKGWAKRLAAFEVDANMLLPVVIFLFVFLIFLINQS